YVFVRRGTNWTQQAYIKASNTATNSYFGRSVAVSGDTIVAGAPAEHGSAIGVNGDPFDRRAPLSGAAYVFVRHGTNWTQQAYLKASNTGAGDRFGYGVAIWDDTIAVGADREDSNATGINGNQNDERATNSGAAYVFVRRGTIWTQQAYLKAPVAQPEAGFGVRLSIFDDTLLIGGGGARIFARAGTQWTLQADLKASNSSQDDFFGYSVAVAESTALVGAYGESGRATGVDANQNARQATNSGAAYVFGRRGTTWSQEAYLKASNGGANDFFGGAVALARDTLVVGASWESSNATGVDGDQNDNRATHSGAAYIFIRSRN
ncbi:MAG TPA: FG-GAP repeat protein, partial [Verrucomicrobiae bacterium]|nr:FG-GAP repeat protein [Verrucomicrobiae bacterium]